MRLIDADELKKCKFTTQLANGVEIYDTEVVLVASIDNAPTVIPEITNDDLQAAMTESYHLGYELAEAKFKRPQGEWEMHRTSVRGRNYTCNNCHKISRNKFCYCPNCGADMRGGKE